MNSTKSHGLFEAKSGQFMSAVVVPQTMPKALHRAPPSEIGLQRRQQKGLDGCRLVS